MKVIQEKWAGFRSRHPELSRLLLFFVLSNGVTVLQIVLMPLLKSLFGKTGLVDVGFTYFIFDYPAGQLSGGGGGGLAYFLAVQITIAIAQVLNFMLQRKITFRARGGIGRAALWYLAAYVVITIGAAALQGMYKVPVYNFFIGHFGNSGETIADLITMIINSAVSFWVFYPIMKWIFKSGDRVS